jgi:hypothetical protein
MQLREFTIFAILVFITGNHGIACADWGAHTPGIILIAAEEASMETLPPGVFMATFANGHRMRSDTEFIGDSWNTEGNTATAGELAAQGFDYTETGGAFVNSPIDDRSYRLKKVQE